MLSFTRLLLLEHVLRLSHHQLNCWITIIKNLIRTNN